MYNGGRNHRSHAQRTGSESYPTPAPSPQVDTNGFPLPPNAPRHHPISLPPRVSSWNQPYLHPLLRYSPYHPFISYDIRHPPTYASAPNTRLEWAHEPATNPSTPQMIITCHGVLPRPFIVRPYGINYDFVTILDVLLAVHREFIEALRATGTSRGPAGSELLLTGTGLYRGPSLRYIWKGLSEERSPGHWLLHVE